jgi:hypothetical protein
MSDDFNPEQPPEENRPVPNGDQAPQEYSHLPNGGKALPNPPADANSSSEIPSDSENPLSGSGSPQAGDGATKSATPKPKALFAPRTLKVCVDTAEKELAATGSYFTVANAIVRVTRDPHTGAGVVRKVGRSALEKELDELVDWYKMSRGIEVQCHPPRQVCSALLEATEFHHLPPLKGFARQPFLRANGELAVQEGYDPASGLFASFGGLRFEVEECPTKEDAEACLALLDGLLDEFPFRSDEDRSAALCAIITAAVRASMEAAPMFLVRAHQAGTGKSYLSRLITAFATGDTPRPLPFPRDGTECAKVIIATLREQPAVLEFDNIKASLVDHESLCAALTADHYQSRELGRSTMVPVATRTLFIGSGNNVEVLADLTRRCITIDLDAKMDTPAARRFTNPALVEDVLAQRSMYVSVALTIIRAWLIANPPSSGLPPLASYTTWSGWCRESLVWLGKPDPASTAFNAMRNDPERAKLRAFITEVERQFGASQFMVKEVIQRATNPSRSGSEDLRDVLLEITGDSGPINRRRLGHWVKQHHGQVVDGYKIVKAPITRSVAVWQIERVAP